MENIKCCRKAINVTNVTSRSVLMIYIPMQLHTLDMYIHQTTVADPGFDFLWGVDFDNGKGGEGGRKSLKVLK